MNSLPHANARKEVPAFVVVVVLLIVSLLSVLLVGALYSDPLRASADRAFASRFDALRADAAAEICAYAFAESETLPAAKEPLNLAAPADEGALAERVRALSEVCTMTPLIHTPNVRVFDVTLTRGRANAHKRMSLRKVKGTWQVEWFYDVRG